MELTYWGLSAVGWRTMTGSLWEQILACFLLVTIVLAVSYLSYRLGRLAVRRIKQRRNRALLPRPVGRYLRGLIENCARLSARSPPEQRQAAAAPKSFGVFLGTLAIPPTKEQQLLLKQWEVLVVDPLQHGVLDGLSSWPPASNHVLARLDVSALVGADASSKDGDVIRNLDTLIKTVNTRLLRLDGQCSPFTGLLLANFSTYFQPAVVNELASLIHDLGLGLWLELSYPEYLTEEEARAVNMKLVQGLVYRNGMIRPDGDRQNYFQMTAMRTVMRAVAFQTAGQSLPVAMWETVDDAAEMQYAVVARCHKLCTFYNAMCWIGHANALTDAEAAKTRTVAARPLGALRWLQDEANMAAHNEWRANDDVSATPAGHTSLLLDSLACLAPNLSESLRLLPPADAGQPASHSCHTPSTADSNRSRCSLVDPLSTSSDGHDFTGLGCFQLGHEPCFGDFDRLRESQRRLERLGLLERLGRDELAKVHGQIAALQGSRHLERLGSASHAVADLVKLLAAVNQQDDQNAAQDPPRIRIFSGLHSAFQTDAGAQYWGLYSIEPAAAAADYSDCVVLYLSNKSRAEDCAAVILHTYLSSRQCSRTDCFLAEQAMGEANGNNTSDALKPFARLGRDIERLSPPEALLLVERLQSSQHSTPLVAAIREHLEYQLLELPTLAQQRSLCSTAYLGGEISAESLVASRLSWLASKGCWIPDQSKAVAAFNETQARLHSILMTGQGDVYAQMGTTMQALVKRGQMDAGADILCLAVFCAFRKLALDEVYLEVLDRNVYPNHAADQPGCFAEHFALGSRCDSFFDTNARNIGRIVANRYRDYYLTHQPPAREEGFTELPTTYAAMQADFDPDDGPEPMPWYHQITFFGIFAVPALVDVMLLTTLGRGLFLTTFMTSEQKTTATTALMLALLISGAFGAWICSGGSYYFFASAFPAMNLFVLTRFVAGLAFTLVVGVVGFVGFAVVRGITAALTFAFYISTLSTYMLVLSALSIYQLPRSSFLSGRTTVLACVPILFLSPVVSIFTGNDILVYVPVLTAFLAALLVGGWRIIGRWSSWYLEIPFVSDAEVVEWWCRSNRAGSSDLRNMSDARRMHLARVALHGAVVSERRRRRRGFLSRSSSSSGDPLVQRLSEGYEPTMFLMRWYSQHKRSRMPLPYSTTWNLMMKAAMENMTKMQKGLKLHSAFLHWRTTGLDIWSGLLYFLVALTDKWVALFTGANLVGLSAAASQTFRLGVGWGLCYYLAGALMLDILSQPLWSAANDKSAEPIASLAGLDEVTARDALAKRRLYWRCFVKFFLLHLWAAAAFAAPMWAFQDSREDTIMFLAYVGAYSGLLWYQYNKIFCGTDGAGPLAVGAVVGVPAGIALHACLPEFAYSGPISLGMATWPSGLLSLFLAMRQWPPFYNREPELRDKTTTSRQGPQGSSYSVSSLEPYPDFSHATIHQLFEAARRLPADRRCALNPSEHPGSRVAALLSARNLASAPSALQAAFPSAGHLMRLASERWEDGKTTVELVSARDFPPIEPRIRAVCRKTAESLHVFVILAPDRTDDKQSIDVRRRWSIIAEAIIGATARHWLGLSHEDAMLAELLVVGHLGPGELSVPEGVKHQLETSPEDRYRLVNASGKTLLRYLLLGVDSEREWDHLSKPVRSFLLGRLCGIAASPPADVEDWLRKRLDVHDPGDVGVAMARCKVGDALTRAVLAYARELGPNGEFARWDWDVDGDGDGDGDTDRECVAKHPLLTEWTVDGEKRETAGIKMLFSSLLHSISVGLKFMVIPLTADPEYQRELDFVMADKPPFLRWPIVLFLNTVWSYCRFLQTLIVPVVLLHGREHATKIQKLTQGTVTVEKSRVVTETLSGPFSWFWTVRQDGRIGMSQYDGRHDAEPAAAQALRAVNTYTDKLVLEQRDVYENGSVVSSFQYQYRDGGDSRLPMQRECTMGERHGELVQYDQRGYVTSGSAVRDGNRVTWKLWHRKNAKSDDELLWAEYTFPHMLIKVLWSMPPRNSQSRLEEWIPCKFVTEATFIQGEDTYHASWGYEHKFHPDVAVTLNGKPVPTPPMIRHDWFNVLKKPQDCSFLGENPLLSFSSIKTNALSRFLGMNVKRYPISISAARTKLWKAWRSTQDVDAVSARWLDEQLMRSDGASRPYWRLRDFGLLHAARAYLDAHADAIMASVDVDPQTSSWTHLAFKMSDLYSFGQGGDARINTRTLESQLLDGESQLHVLAMDTSTWPNDPGGVSNCRRDMVNNLKTIRWHVVAETANDYGVPRFQIERNVQSLTVLPLWGLDFLNPTHGVLETTLDSAVVRRSKNTKAADIAQNFLPILASLVRCARAIKISRQHVHEATRALVDLNTYFESSRNWNDVWSHALVKRAWRELWLSEDMKDNAVTISRWWDFEKPSIKHLDDALNLWCRYLFIFSLPVPARIPDVFQASHHFCGAMYGVVCRVKRGCSLHVWDHCVSFREFTTFMSSAVSYDQPFVNSSLISLTHLGCVLLEHHADVVLPCCDYFNPGWEIELGTADGALEHRRTFARKIDPVVNGISNMDNFKPIEVVKTETPTVIMLSHVQYPKDLKNAILSCDVIVNKWGFRDYRLNIYGEKERHATIATECQEIIASKNLQDHCALMGLANPSVVLQTAWLFLNSSITEGLPLAMGEAALTGVPVVCTDVGASYCVVTDRATGQRFSEVVPPNDPEALARAQISVMGMLGPWSAYAEDEPGTDVPVLAYPTPSPDQVRRIRERIYAKADQRRALGLRGRRNVINNFSAERYLREHEQMLWIGKERSPAHRAREAALRGGDVTPRSIGSASLWLGRSEPDQALATTTRHRSRLTPELWASLATEKEKKALWWRSSRSSSTLAASGAQP